MDFGGKRPGDFVDFRQGKKPREAGPAPAATAAPQQQLRREVQASHKRAHHEAAGDGEVSPGTSGAEAPSHARGILLASDLENSLALLAGVLRWRSPIKPHKLPRLHGPHELPGRRTAVRGIVELDPLEPDPDHEHAEQQQQQHAHQPQQQQRTSRGGAHAHHAPHGPEQQQQQQQCAEDKGGLAGSGSAIGGSAVGCSKPEPDRGSDWSRLFSSLALDEGLGGRSQRTDPVWGAASSNRAGGAPRRPGGTGANKLTASSSSTTTTTTPARATPGPNAPNAPVGAGGGASGAGSCMLAAASTHSTNTAPAPAGAAPASSPAPTRSAGAASRLPPAAGPASARSSASSLPDDEACMLVCPEEERGGCAAAAWGRAEAAAAHVRAAAAAAGGCYGAGPSSGAGGRGLMGGARELDGVSGGGSSFLMAEYGRLRAGSGCREWGVCL